MKPGMAIGQSETLQLKVTPDMFAEFGGQVVHPAYSTAWMVYHMEWASRLIILPYLEDGEEGMGAEVSLKHIAPARDQDEITVTATVSLLEGNAVWTDVQARTTSKLIGAGSVKQVILPKLKINKLLKT
ncbi:thioesterase [Bacillus sp. FJAT-27225]|uniref:thioesterase family protein n=1 Tax=Bacillus sp. FJAT-27225 TaxID=1743144 RepID=UPI00080C28D9|nr:thioesterase [Bacillus sp. FJAT-27225]OCA90644.1 thioesterase [Bacillus sp. FJAT-27225]